MVENIGFIGAGNMSGAIINGILKAGLLKPEQISVSNRHIEKLRQFASMGLFTSTDNIDVAKRADLLILGIKPQVFDEVLPTLAKDACGKGIVSISPGYSLAYLRKQLPACYVMRAMPNTPLLVGRGCTAIAKAPGVPSALTDSVKALFCAAGAVEIVDESLMDTVIAVSGSSPAYFFRMADAMVSAAKRSGMDEDTALRMAALTMGGAAEMLLKSGKSAGELTRQVCSPGGTTLAALSAFDEGNFEHIISDAMARCIQRSGELGR